MTILIRRPWAVLTLDRKLTSRPIFGRLAISLPSLVFVTYRQLAQQWPMLGLIAIAESICRYGRLSVWVLFRMNRFIRLVSTFYSTMKRNLLTHTHLQCRMMDVIRHVSHLDISVPCHVLQCRYRRWTSVEPDRVLSPLTHWDLLCMPLTTSDRLQTDPPRKLIRLNSRRPRSTIA